MTERHRYPHILRALLDQPWAILPSALQVLVEIVARGATGNKLSAEERAARIAAASKRPGGAGVEIPGSIVVLPLFGVLAPRIEMVEDVSNPGTCLDRYGDAFQAAVDDTNVSDVVLQIDSVGGSVYGTQELAERIYAGRQKKRVITSVESGMAASAAWWIGSQAGEVCMSPSSQVGSIGVIAAHEDWSKALEMMGVDVTFVTAPEGGYKAEGNFCEPLSEEGRAYWQQLVETYYAAFSGGVARGRGLKLKAVQSEEWGKGRMITAARALEVGMVDRIETLQQTIARLAGTKGKSSGARALVAAGAPSVSAAEHVVVAADDDEHQKCGTCDHDREQHPNDGSCSVDGCKCERYADDADNTGATAPAATAVAGGDRELARAKLAAAAAMARAS